MENNYTEQIVMMAHALGEKIKEDERFLRYDKAEKDFRAAPEISRLITEYNAQQTALSKVYTTEDVDRDLITAIEGRVNTLYMEITENPVFREFNESKDELDALIKEVNDEIFFVLTGQRPHSCSGDCSTCGSACGHDHSHE